jgi:hypothetical protein
MGLNQSDWLNLKRKVELMPTKKTTKKELKIEEIAAKTIDEISADLVSTQNKSRTAFNTVGDALITKKSELEDLIQAIELKQAELKELGEKEKLALSIQELREQFEDRKHEFERNEKQLKMDYEDKQESLERAYQANVLQEKRRIEDEERSRSITLEDEDRIRERTLLDREAELVARENELEKKALELGSFENRVEEEVERKVQAAKVKMNFESQSLKTKYDAEIQIQKSQIAQLEALNADLTNKLGRAEDQAQAAADRANAIAIASLDAESGKKALEKVESIAQKQAESGKR